MRTVDVPALLATCAYLIAVGLFVGTAKATRGGDHCEAAALALGGGASSIIGAALLVLW